ncbi:hypothetical protein BKA69DRAFT_1124222 [Paraphysoderma sedebokerense]|nr:hypothetical protein BKA69DRAFT_1124222 [Paraphysoderma sedebokerense]
MIFTASIAFLAAVASVSAYPGKVEEPVPTITKSTPGCYIVALETKSGPISAEICSPHEPIIHSSDDGCFSFGSETQSTVLCRDGTARSASFPVAKRSIRPEIRKIYKDCYEVSLASVKGTIGSVICGAYEPKIEELKEDCFSATIDNNSVSLCMDGSLASSTSETAEK